LGIKVALATDGFCTGALKAGMIACGLEAKVTLVTLGSPAATWSVAQYWDHFENQVPFPLSHVIAIERVGPSHTPESVLSQPGATGNVVTRFWREVPPHHRDRCQTMRGRDITSHMSPAHLLFEGAGAQTGITTIGIGDGGNEIGMGKISWDVIRRNIPHGGLVACRVSTDYLIVCGISNWGAYGLGAGVRLLRGLAPEPGLFDGERERELLRVMVEQGPLVDGVTGKPTVTVDGLPFDRYAEPLRRLGEIR
jgi:hypothetical protein